MEKVKIGIIGNFGGNQELSNGQTIKTYQVNKQIEQHYNIETNKVDTYYISKPFKLFFNIIKLIKNNDNIILIVSIRGYQVILLLSYLVNKFYKRNLYDFVIGGTRYEIYDKHPFMIKLAKCYKKIYVETNKMKEEYLKRGLNNVEILPNFKDIKIIESNKKFINKKKLKVCTFTRILKSKGIEDAIESVILANKKMKKEVFELDIYGKVDDDYINDFNEILKKVPNFIHYKGIVPFNSSSNILHKYDLMLFLTFWPSEGFPGTIIDSFCSGVPVIATEWNCNFEILEENETGFKVNVNDVNHVSNLLIECYNNQKEIFEMRKKCLKEAKKYLPDNVMKKFFDEIDK